MFWQRIGNSFQKLLHARGLFDNAASLSFFLKLNAAPLPITVPITVSGSGTVVEATSLTVTLSSWKYPRSFRSLNWIVFEPVPTKLKLDVANDCVGMFVRSNSALLSITALSPVMRYTPTAESFAVSWLNFLKVYLLIAGSAVIPEIHLETDHHLENHNSVDNFVLRLC